jgi:hypothetical protein
MKRKTILVLLMLGIISNITFSKTKDNLPDNGLTKATQVRAVEVWEDPDNEPDPIPN